LLIAITPSPVAARALATPRFEALVANAPVLNGADPAGSAAAPAVAQLLATYKVARQHCWTRLCVCPRVLWSFREAEAKEELTYALLRARS
jgi:hypothetical protein